MTEAESREQLQARAHVAPGMPPALRLAKSQPPIRQDALLIDAPEMFRSTPDCWLLPVVDETGRPVGAIAELAVRGILFNPYGHALLANPSFGRDLRSLITPCPTAGLDLPADALISSFAEAGGGEGLILTRGGCYAALLPAAAIVQMTMERDADLARQRIERLVRIDALAADFDGEAAALAEHLAASAHELGQTAEKMADNAQRNGEEAVAVAGGAKQTAEGMADAARNSSALAAAADQVRRHAEQVRSAAIDAVSLVGDGDARSEALQHAAQDIEQVVELIHAISGKTNLLALNAAIEAARSGPSGRSFTVVANEVKALALQTRAEASRIADRVAQMRTAIDSVTEGRNGIRRAIMDIDRLSAEIHGAAEEQGIATYAIATTVAQAAAVSTDIRGSIERVGERALRAGDRAQAILATAGHLGRSAELMRDRVRTFLGEMRIA